MILGSPVAGQIYLTESGTRFYRSQRFGCDGYGAEQKLGSCEHFHRAIDIAPSDGRAGVNLVAAAAGRVFAASSLTDGAKVVGIAHPGGFATGYAHNASNLVSVGQQVAKGQHIAEMGRTGIATGIHVHFILKGDFVPAGNAFDDLNDLILDDPKYGFSGIQPKLPHGTGRGTWLDPWPRLEQNVTVRPAHADVNIRATAGSGSTPGALYATTKADGHIHSTSGADLGLTADMRKWGGRVQGAAYTVGGVQGTTWERIWLGGAYRFVASLLAVRSAS